MSKPFAEPGLAVQVIDSHTEGMPTRVIVGGIGELPGATMDDRRAYFLTEMSGLRTFLMCEPRGHEAMTGALLQRSTRRDADFGVIWMEVKGSIAACGHGAMGVAAVLVDTGRIPVTEPVTTVRLDTPSGLVVARVQVSGGRIGPVTLTMAPSFSVGLDLSVDVPGYGALAYDLAYGGNHCVITDLDRLGLPFDRSRREEILHAGLAIVAAVAEQVSLTHPDGSPSELRHAQLVAPGSTSRHSRHAMVIAPGWFDRSPCGTGTAARMAQLNARGELNPTDEFINESFIGSSFVGRISSLDDLPGTVGSWARAGLPANAVLPEITGRAFITGTAEFVLDPADPFAFGFLI